MMKIREGKSCWEIIAVWVEKGLAGGGGGGVVGVEVKKSAQDC